MLNKVRSNYHNIQNFLQMRELEMGDKNSKSLLANVLDLEGDFILAPNSHPFEATEATEAGYGTAWFLFYQSILLF